MSKEKYLLIDASILPEVYLKVMDAKKYLLSGEAESVSHAVKMVGISRSAYYKYKDKIFEYSEQGEDTVTIDARLEDNAGVLSSVMSELYLAGANVLSVNQSVPVNSVANVLVTVSVSDAKITNEDLIDKIKKVGGVKSAVLIDGGKA